MTHTTQFLSFMLCSIQSTESGQLGNMVSIANNWSAEMWYYLTPSLSMVEYIQSSKLLKRITVLVYEEIV